MNSIFVNMTSSTCHDEHTILRPCFEDRTVLLGDFSLVDPAFGVVLSTDRRPLWSRRTPPLPGTPLKFPREQIRVQNLGHNLERVHHPRTRPVHVLVAIHEKHAAALNGSQTPPFRALSQRTHLLASPRQVEAAGRHYDHVRIGG